MLAHHDDEVFCAGALSAALRAGRRVALLWATVGGLAPAAVRLAEGRRVRSLLRLPARACCDVGLRDQSALRGLTVIAQRADELLSTAGAADDVRVYAPAYEGGHPDHDAVNAAAALLRRRRPHLQVYEFSLYRRGRFGIAVRAPEPCRNTDPRPFTIERYDEAALRLRRCLMLANCSQLAPSLLPLQALACARGRCACDALRDLPSHDYSRPPHDGVLLYEVYTRRRFAEFRDAARAEGLAGRSAARDGNAFAPRVQ